METPQVGDVWQWTSGVMFVEKVAGDDVFYRFCEGGRRFRESVSDFVNKTRLIERDGKAVV